MKGVSFEVEEGEFVAVLGSNGSGKSTLAKLINALFVPTAGTVTVCGIDTRDEARAEMKTCGESYAAWSMLDTAGKEHSHEKE